MDEMIDTTETALIVAPVAQGFGRDQLDLIKRTVANGTTDDEFALFIEVCKRTRLDPFSRQIYAIMRYDRKVNRAKMTIQTGIDGYLAIAHRTGQVDGIDDIVFDVDDADHPNRATATVYRFNNGHRSSYTFTARWREYNSSEGPMWGRMPYTMLGKVALARALRLAFPSELGGVYTDDEMMQADTPTAPVVDATPVTTPAPVTQAAQPAPAAQQAKPAAKAAPANDRKAPPAQGSVRLLGRQCGYESQADYDAMVVRVTHKSKGWTAPDQWLVWDFLTEKQAIDAQRAADAAAEAGERDMVFVEAIA